MSGHDLAELEISEKFTPESIAELLECLSAGETLLEVCKRPEMPSTRSVQKWVRRHEGFARLYRQCRLEGVLHMLEEAKQIADDSSKDVYKDKNEIERVDHGRVQRDRLRCDVRIKVADRLARALRDVAPAGRPISPLEELLRKLMALPEDKLDELTKLSGFELKYKTRELFGGSANDGPEDPQDPSGGHPNGTAPAE